MTHLKANHKIKKLIAFVRIAYEICVSTGYAFILKY